MAAIELSAYDNEISSLVCVSSHIKGRRPVNLSVNMPEVHDWHIDSRFKGLRRTGKLSRFSDSLLLFNNLPFL